MPQLSVSASRGRLRRRAVAVATAISLVPCGVAATAALLPPETGDLAYAYLDPGTGSFLIQALVAAVAGVAVTVRLYWRRIKAFLTGKPVEVDVDDDE